MKHYYLTLFIFLTCLFSLNAQNKGSISGIIKDKEMNNEPLPFANAFIKNTNKGTTTDMQGNYIIENVEPGNYTIIFSFVGYETLEKKVTVEAGKEVKVDAILGTGNVTLDEVIVEVQTNRESENVLLLEQKKAVVAKQAIGAKELSRKGVSDAQGAVTKISGVSKQEGVKSVFVRGLGDRYNSTTLNGFPIPSEDPEYKNISLGFFGTDIIQNIGVNKVFSGDHIGDVGGAVIDISSKQLSGQSALQLDLSLGSNTAVLGSDFLKQDGVSYFGFSNKAQTSNDLSKYTFPNSLDPAMVKTPFNHSYGISGGKKVFLADNPLSLFFVGSYSSDYSFTDEVIRNTNTAGNIFKDQKGKKYSQNINQLALINALYKIGGKHRLMYNFMMVHNNSQYVADYEGIESEKYQNAYDGASGFMRRQQNNDNLLLVNQLSSKWELSKKWDLNSGVSFNKVIGDEPDRRINNFTKKSKEGKYSLTGGTGRQARYYLTLDENDLNVKVALSHKLSKNEEDNISKLEFGYNGRFITDNFSATEYNFTVFDRAVNGINLGGVFNQPNLTNGKFKLEKNFDTYSVDKNISSGFIEMTYLVSPKFITNIGVSLDNVDMNVSYDVNKGANKGANNIKKTFFLPSINIKYDIIEKHSLRLGASKTYTLPQSKEISPYIYVGPNFSSQGNKNLKPSDNYNFDIKWDYYISPSELFSLTLFQKYIANPIARVEEGGSGGYLTYKNISKSAIVAGLEIEVRKNLYTSSTENKDTKLSAGLNASYTYSNLEVDVLNTKKRDSQLEGAAPFLTNIDLTYNYNKLTTSLVLNYFSDRVYTIGTLNYKDIIEKGVSSLDFVSSMELSKHLSLKLKARNLLNPTYELSRKTSAGNNIVLNSYKKGVSISLGVSYKF